MYYTFTRKATLFSLKLAQNIWNLFDIYVKTSTLCRVLSLKSFESILRCLWVTLRDQATVDFARFVACNVVTFCDV